MNTDLKKNKVRFCLHTFMYWIDGLHFCTLEPAFFLMSLLFVYTISLFQILLCQLFLFLSLPEYLFFIKINWYMHWNNLIDHRNLFRSHLTLWSHTYSLWKTKRKARPNDYRIKTTAQNNNRKKLCVFFLALYICANASIHWQFTVNTRNWWRNSTCNGKELYSHTFKATAMLTMRHDYTYDTQIRARTQPHTESHPWNCKCANWAIDYCIP